MSAAAFRTAAGGAKALLEALFRGDANAVTAALGADARLDVPRFDPTSGAEGIGALAARWPEVYPYALVEARLHNLIETDRGLVSEVRTHLAEGEREFALPFAIVESVEDGVTLVRVYHSERLIHGERRGRRPIWPAEPGQEPTPLSDIHPAVAAYMGAIASGEESAVVDRFATGGMLDNGVRPVHEPDELQAIFRAMVRTGGARLVRRREYDDGATVAFEYTGLPRPTAPGEAPRTPPGGGIGIYSYDDDDRICAVRMYDDFDPDALITAGRSA